MGRLQKIEDIVAGTLPPHNNLKMIVRGRPNFIDPQLDGGSLRFSSRRGSQFTAIMPDNQSYIVSDAPKESTVVQMESRSGWLSPRSLVRIGVSEASGELNIVFSLIGTDSIELTTPLLVTYYATPEQDRIPSVSLIGTPCTVLPLIYKAPPNTQNPRKVMYVESWHPIMPKDKMLMSPTPDVLQSMSEYTVSSANFVDTSFEDPDSPVFTFETSNIILSADTIIKTGHGLTNDTKVSFTTTGDLPSGLTPNVIYYVRDTTTDTFKVSASVGGPPVDIASVGLGTHTVMVGRTLYRYEVMLATDTGLLPFIPKEGLTLYLKAQPCYFRTGFNEVGGDIALPNDIGPFLLDAFHGTLLVGYNVKTVFGLRTFDSFGTQINQDYALGQQWQTFDSGNYLILERPIKSDALLFWQRIKGNFQFQKGGYFQAELDSDGEFTISTDLLVPPWPTDKDRGWVIPLLSRVEATVVVQFEPQEQQTFTISGNTINYIRPKIYADPSGAPIRRMLMSFKSTPNSRIEIRDWEFDGPAVNSLSYFILGTGDAWGVERWMAGGFSVKPLFYDLSVLNARYSDGVSKYNTGYIYS